VKDFSEALHKAAQDTAAYMTFDVRRSARSHGWQPHEVSSLRVRYSDGNFNINAEGEHKEAALTKEYGTEQARPTAVIRKYSNNPGKSADVLIQQLKKYRGGRLL
jgi:hypothetical protein